MTAAPTITPEEALAKIREALEIAYSVYAWPQYRKALSLLPIIESAMLPELPYNRAISHLIITNIQRDSRHGPVADMSIPIGCEVMTDSGKFLRKFVTPRAAVIAAIEKVKP